MSSALAGGFLTTGPPGKPYMCILYIYIHMYVWHRDSKMSLRDTYYFRSGFCGKQYIENVPTVRSYPSPFASASWYLTSTR